METRNLKVIYKITNKVTGKFYIGSTKDHKKRFSTHRRLLLTNKHHNRKLQNSFNKHGKDSFVYEIILTVLQDDSLLEFEQYFIDSLCPYYNIALSSSSPMLGRKHTEETIIKIKEELATRPKGELHPNYGRRWTEEQKQHFVKIKTGTKRTEETKRKMSETSKRLNRYNDLIKAIEGFKEPITDNKGNTFSSMIEAANHHGIKVATVCDILKRRHYTTRDGVTFNYLNQPNLPYVHKKFNGKYKGVSRYHRNKKRWVIVFNSKKYYKNNEQDAIAFYRELWYNTYGIKLCDN